MGHRIFALDAFLNEEGAFHNTSFEAMGKTRADHEMHCTNSRWIEAMLSNRMVRAEIRGVSSLLVRLNNERLWAQGFVDDIAIVINGKCLSTVCELMQKTLFILQTLCRGVVLMVFFTNNRK
jgi:hypothetical protein